MSNLSARDVAAMVAAGGRKCYEDDGEVVPTMFFVGTNLNGIMLHPDPRLGERPPVAYAEVVFRIGKLYPWRIIGTSSEVWTRTFPEEDDRANTARQGDLQRMAEAGDPEVRTAVVGQAIDLRNHAASFTEISTAKVLDRGGIEWDTTTIAGIPEGDMTAMLLDAYSHSIPPPPGSPAGLGPLSVLCDALMAANVATSAMLMDS